MGRFKEIEGLGCLSFLCSISLMNDTVALFRSIKLVVSITGNVQINLICLRAVLSSNRFSKRACSQSIFVNRHTLRVLSSFDGKDNRFRFTRYLQQKSMKPDRGFKISNIKNAFYVKNIMSFRILMTSEMSCTVVEYTKIIFVFSAEFVFA
ncbi:hypothetical protein PPL_06801 [Heterostelium album PN500]|uniref:Uncharacterized protein n=1 Tax=Heterostelium pallidum (strain ATCC 26659 / Pp 5 / PN500) TaxID=670386 RepID=D3BDJ9_HETP5|nr:hypothetical protein PPL_06801 [Heterostelium album PN500]EFA79980.1 hypothetical protein PPL_06801 [Heterostelium album PN500]|eukprot:XP_020432100.1 hypothetical protein PPL_06801 [Heterostelium album PN500]